MQSLNGRIGSKIRLKWTVTWFSWFLLTKKICKQFENLVSSQNRCHETPIDIKNCVKTALISNLRKQFFTMITNWGGGDYQLRSALAAKHIWVAVINRWGTSGLPPSLCNVHALKVWYYTICEYWRKVWVENLRFKPVSGCIYFYSVLCWIYIYIFNSVLCCRLWGVNLQLFIIQNVSYTVVLLRTTFTLIT